MARMSRLQRDWYFLFQQLRNRKLSAGSSPLVATTQISVDTTGATVNLIGTDTTWLDGHSFTVTGVNNPTIVSQVIRSDTSATLTLNTGSAPGILTIMYNGIEANKIVVAPKNAVVSFFDNFKRPNTSLGGVGNDWIDVLTRYQILSNQLKVPSAAPDFLTRLCRPSTEAFKDGIVRQRFGPGYHDTDLAIPMVLGRVQNPSSSSSPCVGSYFVPSYQGTGGVQFVIFFFDGTNANQIGTINGASIPSEGWVELKLDGVNVTATIYEADGLTIIYTQTGQVTGTYLNPGSAGFCTYGQPSYWSEVEIYVSQKITADIPALRVGDTQTIHITGSNTNFSGSPFTIGGSTGSTIVSQTVIDATNATLVITGGNVAGKIILIDSSDNVSLTIKLLEASTIVYDTFNRPDTAVGTVQNSTNIGSPSVTYAPSTGGSWIDLTGDLWHINGLKVENYGIHSPPAAPTDGYLYRPGVENLVNGKLRSTINPTLMSNGENVGAVSRAIPGVSCYGFLYYFPYSGAPFIYLYTNIAGIENRIVSAHPTGVPTPDKAIIEFVTNQKDSATTTLTVNVYDGSLADPYAVPVYSFFYDDATPELQNTSGAMGLSSYFNTAANEVQILNLGGHLVMGNINDQGVYKTNAYMNSAGAAGGTAPYTYQWHRSTTSGFTPNSGNAISGATALNLHDTGLTPGTNYYYVVTATDALGAIANGTQFTAATVPTSGHVFGYTGDSITYGVAATQTTCAAYISPNLITAQHGIVCKGINAGVSGSTSYEWITGTTNLAAADAAFANRDIDAIHIMIGTNNTKNTIATPAANYRTDVANQIAHWVGQGKKVILSYSPYLIPGSGGVIDANSDVLLQAYQTEINSLVDGVNVFQGDTQAYTYFQGHQSELPDGIHPDETGHGHLGQFWADAIYNNYIL